MSSKWWPFVASGEAWSTPLAELMERALITDIGPVFNAVYSLGSDERIVEYLARREAWDLLDWWVSRYELDR